MRKAAFVYSDAMSRHVLRENHVMRPTRLRLTYELLDAYGAFEESLLLPPQEAGEEDILSFHTKPYVEAVKNFSRGQFTTDPAAYNFSEGGDNPIFEGMYEASALAVGASLVAAELVVSGQVEVAFNAAGGLHHAGPSYASGFCTFNDPVIAIKSLIKRGLRIAYVDIDAHHGDGVQDAFYDTDQVLTISLHESGSFLFPGTGEIRELGKGKGRGYSVNLPLAPFTEDDLYLWAFEEIVPPLVSHFRPDVLVTQLGVDTHHLDPLAHLSLTTEGYTQVVKRFKELAPSSWLALGGGGYEMGVVPRAWTLAYGIMMDKEWPNDIPADYQERFGLKKLRDEDKPSLSEAARGRAQHLAEENVAEIKKLIFPLHSL
ncbi:MAG: acetoin utilization protein AcuC [Chloroflexi bacterium]|nr:acetoin utilization protein AcuC [Chloroflexota bacterium]